MAKLTSDIWTQSIIVFGKSFLLSIFYQFYQKNIDKDEKRVWKDSSFFPLQILDELIFCSSHI